MLSASQRLLFLFSATTMDSFDNFQYDSASSYGGMGIVDDTSSVYTANTSSHTPLDLESLSIVDDRSHVGSSASNGHTHALSQNGSVRLGVDEDFDAVLDDLKDDAQVDLPPHACRCVLFNIFEGSMAHFIPLIATVAFTIRRLLSNVSYALSGSAILAGIRLRRIS